MDTRPYTRTEQRRRIAVTLLAFVWLALSASFYFLAIDTLYMVIKDVLIISAFIFIVYKTDKNGHPDNHGAEEFRDIFYHHPTPMWIFDPGSLEFLSVNLAAIQNYGYSEKEFLSMNIMQIRPENEVQRIIEEMRRPKKNVHERSVWTHRKKNGELIDVEVVASDVTFNGRSCRVVAATDITEHIKKEEQILKLSLVAENTTSSVILSDEDGRIEWVNQAFTALTGYTLDEVKGKHPRSFLHGADTDREIEKHILDRAFSGKSYVGEILNYKKDGSPFWIQLNLTPVFKNEKIIYYVIIQTDITYLKLQSERISKQVELFKKIAFTASHNFRRPLANILGLIELVELNDHELSPDTIIHLKTSAKELDQEVIDIVRQTTQVLMEN